MITAERVSTCSLPGAIKTLEPCGRTTIAWCLRRALAGLPRCWKGTAEPVVGRRIVGEHPEATVLKAAHHGSASATSPDLLATLHPRYAIISVGARNGYGHPRREVLARLQQAGVRTYRTDEEGAVSFYLDGKSVTPEVALIP